MNKMLGQGVLGIFIMTTVLCSLAWSDATVIAKGKKAKFDYTLKVEGQVVETTTGRIPLEYVHGEGQLIPGLEAQLEGMKVGDTKTITVQPKDAYGDVNPQAYQEFQKTFFPKDFSPKKGMVVELQSDKGQTVPAVVSEIKDSGIVLDLNHPMAGKTLQFDVKIVSIE